MELERVSGVSMCDLGFQVSWQVDDCDSLEWAPIILINSVKHRHGRVTHFLTQIPQPIHKNSEMKAILSLDLTSMQSFPVRGKSLVVIGFANEPRTHLDYWT